MIFQAEPEGARMKKESGRRRVDVNLNQLDQIIGNMLDSDGILAGRTDGINRSVKDINNRREGLERRLAMIETRYRAQFTALDTMIASMTQTSNYLTQQLANLPGSSSSS